MKLTNEQELAASSSHRLTSIEAYPGSGKTVVAAERFGRLRFKPSRARGMSVIAVSFTRSASAELRSRIVERWGEESIAFPHFAGTIDSWIRSIVNYLLRKGTLSLPGKSVELTPIDGWNGQKNARAIKKGWLCGTRVSPSTGTIGVETNKGSGFGFSKKADLLLHLREGRCTHDDIRDILQQCLDSPRLREEIVRFTSKTTRAMIFDEVYDANPTDLALIQIAAQSGADITVLGDKWQAIYEFRGAVPSEVDATLSRMNFCTHSLTHSFRFKTEHVRNISESLREGGRITLPTTSPPDTDLTADVALSSRWSSLWKLSTQVLPLSFGKLANMTDATLTTLLDAITRSKLGLRAIYTPESKLKLGLPHLSDSEIDALFHSPIAMMTRSDDPKLVLSAARDSVKAATGRRPPRSAKREKENGYIRRCKLLTARVRSPTLIPGLTVHQAKGKEWDRVGVHLSGAQQGRLKKGLSSDSEKDRVLYVALTRGRFLTYRMKPD